MFRFFQEIFRWETIRDTGVHFYQQNRKTGRRRLISYGAGHQPIDKNWLEG